MAKTLKDIAIHDLMRHFYNDPDLRALLTAQDFHILDLLIEDKVSKLILPVELKKELIDYMQYIGLLIMTKDVLLKKLDDHVSKIFNTQCQSFKPVLDGDFKWTLNDCLDLKRSLEPLIKQELLTQSIRFIDACVADSEDDEIIRLYEQMPQYVKDRLCHLNLVPKVTYWVNKLTNTDDARDNK